MLLRAFFWLRAIPQPQCFTQCTQLGSTTKFSDKPRFTVSFLKLKVQKANISNKLLKKMDWYGFRKWIPKKHQFPRMKYTISRTFYFI